MSSTPSVKPSICPTSTADTAGVVLVTGANGLVGQALCRELASRGFTVRAAVRTPSTFTSVAGVQAVAAPDLADAQAQWPVSGVDVVIHTAARVHVMNPATDEIEHFMAVNRDGTLRLARACVDAGVKRLVFLSTIKVNGEETEPGQVFSASDQVKPPQDPYALSKYEAEQGLFALAMNSQLEVVVIRPPLVYGPDAKGNLELLEKAIRKRVPLPIGLLDFNRRSLVSLANLVDLVATCAWHPAASGQVFLASDGHDLSTLALAQQIARACGLPLRALPVPVSLLKLVARLLGKGEMMRRLAGNLQVDVGSTCQTLDWQPPNTVETGMAAAFGSR